jgi:hypothetical protein
MVFLLEERSMKTLLDGLLPRLVPGISIQQPSREIVKLIPEFQKMSEAQRLARHLSWEGNRSRSFQVIMDGVEREFSLMQSAYSENETGDERV